MTTTARSSLLALLLLAACDDEPTRALDPLPPAAEAIYARLGEPIPGASPEQLEAFERGRKVVQRRFTRADGLGPAFNVTFCGACHERPVFGGSAGSYRNFLIGGSLTADGVFTPATSMGPAGGVIRLYYYGDEGPARPRVADEVTVFGRRNAIPFFGVGLIAELDEAEILSREDEDDADGDGISGRANYDQGFVGRFGRKAQTVSIEGFIRGPLFNHLGVTSDPLTDAQRRRLPVDSSNVEARLALTTGTATFGQAAAPSSPLTDGDEAPDPELSGDDLFDLVTFAMLLAPARPEPENEQRLEGLRLFREIGCAACHTPRVKGPRGYLPLFSDLLLHDMGPELADGIPQGFATAAEFRTQPLWGIAAVGPYLHDGRADTLEQAIAWHGGEAEAARERFEALPDADREAVLELLLSLGGRDQYSAGLIPPDEPPPEPGAFGGPVRALSGDDAERFEAGRRLFDREFGFTEGAGQPRLNGDSCRACHFEPTVGGAGPRGVNVTRHGILNADGAFTPPSIGTILHRENALLGHANLPQPEANVFEQRQTPHLFGLGLVDAIPADAILANADPDDLHTADGITGRPSMTDDGRLGRFGWKAQIPTVAEFVRDALTAEIGLTVEAQPGLTFGRIQDNDEVPDPEMSASEAELIGSYLALLAPPPRQPGDAPQVERGEVVFAEVGCAACHIPELVGAAGPVPLYSDLLLHEVLPEGAGGVEEAGANVREFRTAPLWGISHTAPYLHDGRADTLAQAIEGHDGEAAAARDAVAALPAADREALLAFLESL